MIESNGVSDTGPLARTCDIDVRVQQDAHEVLLDLLHRVRSRDLLIALIICIQID